MMTSSSERIKLVREQIILLSIFYVLVTAADWGIFIYEMTSNTIGEGFHGFICVDNKYLVVLSNRGAGMLVGLSIIFISYSICMLIVFYTLPLSHGLVEKILKRPQSNITLSNTNFDLSMQSGQSSQPVLSNAKSYQRAAEMIDILDQDERFNEERKNSVLANQDQPNLDENLAFDQ